MKRKQVYFELYEKQLLEEEENAWILTNTLKISLIVWKKYNNIVFNTCTLKIYLYLCQPKLITIIL
jgi:hypothetical protein